jgi:hypothetical protein
MASKIADYDIVGSYNNQRVSSIDAERSVNLFEYIDPLGKKPKSLINTSGLINTNLIFVGANGGARGQFVFQTNQYMVFGSGVYRMTSTGVVSQIGTLQNTIAGYVGIDANTFQVIFVDGVNGYIWDTMANTFTMITDTSFPPKPIDVCYLDGFFVVADGDTNNFQLSSFNQGLVWGPDSQTFTADDTAGNNWLILTSTANYQTGVPFTVSNSGGALPMPLATSTTYYAIRLDATHIRVATSYANAIAGIPIMLSTNGTGTNTITSDGQLQLGSITTHPGTIVACRTLHRRLFLFSQFFTEVWENAGIGTNLPFRRNNALLMEYGTPAIGSVSVGFDKMFFLSQDRDGLGSVMEVIGTQSIPVSNRALDFQLAQYAADQQVADCRSFLIKENGLIFYRMNFTLANHTFVYNVTLSEPSQEQGKLWHEEEILDGDRHPAQTHAYFNGINYVGNYLRPILYQVDSGTYTNDGEIIRRMRITKAIVPPGYQRLRIDRLQVDLLQGNIADNGMSTVQDLNLDTESGNDLLTESGFNIIVENGITIHNSTGLWVFLSLSKDGGQTYGYKVRAPMGNVGQRTFRTVWRKLGTIPRGQALVAKFEFWDDVPFVILGGAWSYEVMPE